MSAVQLGKTIPNFFTAFHKFHEEARDIRDEQGLSISRIVEEINSELRGWNTTCDIEINPINADDLIKNLVKIAFIDDNFDEGNNIDSSKLGSGLQRHIIFTLITLSAKYKSMQVKKDVKSFSATHTLILFEEPEAYLHPPYQDILSLTLRSLASKEGYQIILTTHSPRFISNNIDDIACIIKTDRTEPQTKVYQIDRDRLENIFEDNTEINRIIKAEPEDDTFEIEMVKHFIWLNTIRSEMFFARNVLLVEGPTDTNLVRYMLNNGLIRQPKYGVTVIDTLGKYNTHRFMALLESFAIKHVVIVDKDKEDAKTYKLNDFILSKKNSCTLDIQFIEDNIESLLGIEQTTRSDRKPQFVLYKILHEGTDLEPFKQIIEQCFIKFNN